MKFYRHHKKKKKSRPVEEAYVIPPTPMADIDDSLLPPTLRPYQVDGVRFLEAVNGKGIISDEPRLGKSAQALGYSFIHPEKRPVIILCPANAKIGWAREIAKWSNEELVILYGRTIYDVPKVSFYIINYDIVYDWLQYLIYIKPQILIVDECHYLATETVKKNVNGKTVNVPVKRTFAFTSLSKEVPHIIHLSGTPITRCPSQFFTVLHSVRPDIFPNRRAYLEKFCDPKPGFRGIVYEGATNVNRLRSLLARMMIRRRKRDVFEFLPTEERIIVPFEVDKDRYEKEAEIFEEWFRENTNATEEEMDRRLSLMKSISYDAKRSQVHEWIKNYLVAEKKLVLFTYHRDVSEDLHNSFKDISVLVYGGMDINSRQKAIDTFQSDEKVLLFIGQIKATNVAISLSASDTVAFVEYPFTPGDLKQAEERIFIPNDGKERLTYYYLVMGDTLDETRVISLQKRAKMLGSILDGSSDVEVFGKDIKKEIKKK